MFRSSLVLAIWLVIFNIGVMVYVPNVFSAIGVICGAIGIAYWYRGTAR